MDKLDFRSCDFEKTGKAMYELAKKLFPICRSITGEGFRQSLKILDKTLKKHTSFSLYQKRY